MKKIVFYVASLCVSFFANAQWTLSIDELKIWTPSSPLAYESLIATVPLAQRFENLDSQLCAQCSNDLEIAYLPDGMTNFASYSQEQPFFNLYNFTNWAYIDRLVWFGGTAKRAVQIPSSPWVNAAHKNGVKTFATVFFAPSEFGGSTESLKGFLTKNSQDQYVSIAPMLAMMEYYNFDGWFINQETNTDSATAVAMYNFLKELTTKVEGLGKEVIWYDAMLLDGSVKWQNELNFKNSPFFQNDEDSLVSTGYEERVSSKTFINFFWSGANMPSSSKSHAATIKRSEFDVFTGVDLWPSRNQEPFETGGNTWMNWLYKEDFIPSTSLGLFAPSVIFNNTRYSNFVNDPSDYKKFYASERRLFTGKDQNPQIEDTQGFKGLANWIPATSVIRTLPFETSFNTGHGLKKFEKGIQIASKPWHNMNDQDILPTWQFAFSSNDLSASWDFFDAYNGGSSLKVAGNVQANSRVDLALYKTKLVLEEDSKIDIVFKKESANTPGLSYVLSFESDPDTEVVVSIPNTGSVDWEGRSLLLNEFEGETLAMISVRFEATQAINDYVVNIGNIKIHNGEALEVSTDVVLENEILVSYPLENNVVIHTGALNPSSLSFNVYNLSGQLVSNYTDTLSSDTININTKTFAKGVYLIIIETNDGSRVIEKIILR